MLTIHGYDEVWVIPCYRHAFSKKLRPFDLRYRLCCRAMSLLGEKVNVMDIEKQLGPVNYTIHTITHLIQTFPKIHFELVVGSDTKASIRTWKDYNRLKKLIPIVFIPRKGHAKGFYLPDISSTVIRHRVLNGLSIEGLVPKNIEKEVLKKYA